MNDLAIMVRKGLDDVTGKLGEHNKQFEALRQGHEDIKLRLDNVAYRFELVELQKRVDVLEKKVGVRHK